MRSRKPRRRVGVREGLHAAFSFAFLLAAGSAAAGPALKVHDAWIEEGPPGVSVLGGYLDLENPGDAAIEVTGVSSDAAAQIEIHRTEIHDGTASMAEVPVLTVPPHARLSFGHGGYHLMLMSLHGPLKAGDRIGLRLHLGGGGTENVEAEVRRAVADPM